MLLPPILFVNNKKPRPRRSAEFISMMFTNEAWSPSGLTHKRSAEYVARNYASLAFASAITFADTSAGAGSYLACSIANQPRP